MAEKSKSKKRSYKGTPKRNRRNQITQSNITKRRRKFARRIKAQAETLKINTRWDDISLQKKQSMLRRARNLEKHLAWHEGMCKRFTA